MRLEGPRRFLKRGEQAGTACCNTTNWFYDQICVPTSWLYEDFLKIITEGLSIQTIFKIFFKSKIPKYHQFLLSSMNIYWFSLSSLILNWIFLDCRLDRTIHLNTFDKLWAFVFIFQHFIDKTRKKLDELIITLSIIRALYVPYCTPLHLKPTLLYCLHMDILSMHFISL